MKFPSRGYMVLAIGLTAMAAFILTAVKPATPFGSMAGAGSSGIRINSPCADAKIQAGDTHSVIIVVTEGHWDDFILTVEAAVRDSHGALIWKGHSYFASGVALIPWFANVEPGQYTLEARTIGMLGYVNSVYSHSVEVVE